MRRALPSRLVIAAVCASLLAPPVSPAFADTSPPPERSDRVIDGRPTPQACSRYGYELDVQDEDRAANTGVSVALAPNGAVIADLRDSSGSPFTRGVMTATLPVGCTEITLYALLGDWAVLACFLLFAALLLRRAGAGKRNGGPVKDGVYRRGATPR